LAFTDDEIAALTRFLRKRFNRPELRVEREPDAADVAGLYLGQTKLSPIERDEDEGEVCYQLEMTLKQEFAEVTQTLRTLFANERLKVQPHPKKKDMAEIFIGEEFIAPIYQEEIGGETAWQLQMAVLDFDLEDMDD